jgi:nitrite reductase (NADH) small subunit
MIGDWLDIGPTDQIAPGNARTLPVRGGQEIAVFHTLDHQFYALVNKCPHKQGPLSQGIVHGHVVTCPLHNWNISLKTGKALGDGEDERGACVPTIPLRVDAGRLYLLRAAVIPPVKAAAITEQAA